MARKTTLISTSSEWTPELLAQFDQQIARVAKQFKLDTYPNQIEIIGAEQMMDAYSSVGMPLGYHHWSFGKQFLSVEKNYKRGHMGLAYELVINSNPCIAYLMEENTLSMQGLVIAHACYGHNSFFKNNYLFKAWTSPDSIVDYLVFAKKYISNCEERYGLAEVENLLDACHALMNHGVDRYKRPVSLSLAQEKLRQTDRANYLQTQVNELWRTLPRAPDTTHSPVNKRFPSEPQENLLYFIEKNAPLLEPWQREIIRIVRKMAQYFYPQRQTKVMNEGWATFWHYTIMTQLYDEKLVNDTFMMEFLHTHTNVIYQPSFDSPLYSGINPYTLGFAIFQDLKRICESPTKEDKEWFPKFANTPWLETLDFAMRNFKDESFISQYLSPKVIRDLKLFSIQDDDQAACLEVMAIHDKAGYMTIRQLLSENYNLTNIDPDIQVYNVNKNTDRSLTLRYTQSHRRVLAKDASAVLQHIYTLWGFPVKLETLSEDGTITLTSLFPDTSTPKKT